MATRWPVSPPASPLRDVDGSLPVLAKNEVGMIADDEFSDARELPPDLSKKPKRTRRRRPKNVSKHFEQLTEAKFPALSTTPAKRKQRRSRKNVSKHFQNSAEGIIATPPTTPAKLRIVAGINIDELSSDSSLTPVPSDIGSDPFESEPSSPQHPLNPTKGKAVKVRHPTKSPYFPNKLRPRFISCLPFPPLQDETFGLMQERLAHDPFRLLVATIFLNKTRGEQAMPVFFQLMDRYPTIADLAAAEVADVVTVIHRLGFQNQRAKKCVEMAKKWLERPPIKGKRWRKLHYPKKGDGRDIPAEEAIKDDDTRVAWEISYLPGLGPYSHDSWRIFCRDELRGLAESWHGREDAGSFEPEWKRVLPTDKELRAYLTWMWLKEGWVWNKETGERTEADEELMEKAKSGGIVQEKQESEYLVVTASTKLGGDNVEKPAGAFMPSAVRRQS